MSNSFTSNYGLVHPGQEQSQQDSAETRRPIASRPRPPNETEMKLIKLSGSNHQRHGGNDFSGATLHPGSEEQGDFKQQRSQINYNTFPFDINMLSYDVKDQSSGQDSIIVPKDWNKFMVKNSNGSVISLLNLPIAATSLVANRSTSGSTSSQAPSIIKHSNRSSAEELSRGSTSGAFHEKRGLANSVVQTRLAPVRPSTIDKHFPTHIHIHSDSSQLQYLFPQSLPKIGRPKRKGVSVPISYSEQDEHDSVALPANTNNHNNNQPIMMAQTTNNSPGVRLSSGFLDKKYKCTQFNCGAQFWNKGHLDRHLRIHSGERPFKCLFEGCEKRFSRQDNMLQHYKIHFHGNSRNRK